MLVLENLGICDLYAMTTLKKKTKKNRKLEYLGYTRRENTRIDVEITPWNCTAVDMTVFSRQVFAG